MVGAVERNAISGFGVCRSRDPDKGRDANRVGCGQQRPAGVRQRRAAVGKERTPGTQRTGRRTGWRRFRHAPVHLIRHAAMMFAIAPAAGGQVRFGVCEQRRCYEREAEQKHQQDSREAPHWTMVLRRRAALQQVSTIEWIFIDPMKAAAREQKLGGVKSMELGGDGFAIQVPA